MPARVPWRRGDVIAGKYRIEGVLGQGGMGVVLAATHIDLQRPVALKLMNDPGRHPDAVRRFRREARLAASLSGDHVARVLDLGHLQDGHPFLVMERLHGQDAAARLRAGPLSLGEALLIALQSLEALAEAHAAGLVHRDIKPANLFLCQDEGGRLRVKVLDFGLSKRLLADEDLHLTASHALLGSPMYAAPEQIRTPRLVDIRADLWSLGVVLHELVAGRPPFQAGVLYDLLEAICSKPAPPLRQQAPAAPEALEAVVLRCLERDPAARFASAQELARALLPLCEGEARESALRVLQIHPHAPTPLPDGDEGDASDQTVDELLSGSLGLASSGAAPQGVPLAERADGRDGQATSADGTSYDTRSGSEGARGVPRGPSAQVDAVPRFLGGERGAASVSAAAAPSRRRWPMVAVALASLGLAGGLMSAPSGPPAAPSSPAVLSSLSSSNPGASAAFPLLSAVTSALVAEGVSSASNAAPSLADPPASAATTVHAAPLAVSADKGIPAVSARVKKANAVPALKKAAPRAQPEDDY